MSALEQNHHVYLCVDERLSNKQSHDGEYEISLRSFLSDVQQQSSTHLVIVVSHGRVLKMLRSLCHVGQVDADCIQQLKDFCSGHVYTFVFFQTFVK
jgi:hypothetical protein